MHGRENDTCHPDFALVLGGYGWGCKVQERHGSDQGGNDPPAAAMIVASSAHNTQRNVTSLSYSYIRACEQEGRIDEALVAFEKQVCLAAGKTSTCTSAAIVPQPQPQTRGRRKATNCCIAPGIYFDPPRKDGHCPLETTMPRNVNVNPPTSFLVPCTRPSPD